MKKLLSALCAVSLTATGASSVSGACDSGAPKQKQSVKPEEQHKELEKNKIATGEKPSAGSSYIKSQQEEIQEKLDEMVAYEIDVNNNTTIDDVKNAVKLNNENGLFYALEQVIQKQYVRSENLVMSNVFYGTNNVSDFEPLKDADVRSKKDVCAELIILQSMKIRVKVKLTYAEIS